MLAYILYNFLYYFCEILKLKGSSSLRQCVLLIYGCAFYFYYKPDRTLFIKQDIQQPN